jgi:hypothetical protein
MGGSTLKIKDTPTLLLYFFVIFGMKLKNSIMVSKLQLNHKGIG